MTAPRIIAAATLLAVAIFAAAFLVARGAESSSSTGDAAVKRIAMPAVSVPRPALDSGAPLPPLRRPARSRRPRATAPVPVTPSGAPPSPVPTPAPASPSGGGGGGIIEG